MKVVSLLPQERFETYKVKLPAVWNFNFLKDQETAAIITACQEADCLLVPGTGAMIDAHILERIPSIRFIQSAATGFNCIDTAAAAKLGIPVANIPGTNINAVAEYTIAMMIALQRKTLMADYAVKAGCYERQRSTMLKQGIKELGDSKLGLVGLGAIGRQVAKLAKALGVSVSYYDVFRQRFEIETELNVTFCALDELLTQSDIVSLHLPLTPETRNMIGQCELSLMPEHSIFINVSRGGLVDQAALAASLASGHLSGAAIDTFYPEPPGQNHPLLMLSPAAQANLVLSPHTAGTTAGAFKKMLATVVDNCACVATGKLPQYIVNGVNKLRKI